MMASTAVMKTALAMFFGFLFVNGAVSKSKKSVEIIVEHKPPTCTEKADRGDLVSVHYTGILKNGKVFDSTTGRQPIEFELGQGKVIKGWDQGIRGMCVGEKRKLVIPPHLGYGSKGVDDIIPPNAVLIFTTELVSVKKKSWFDLRSVFYIGVWPVLAGIVIYSMYRKIAKESVKPHKSSKKNKRK